jgi:hypothetical protein
VTKRVPVSERWYGLTVQQIYAAKLYHHLWDSQLRYSDRDGLPAGPISCHALRVYFARYYPTRG